MKQRNTDLKALIIKNIQERAIVRIYHLIILIHTCLIILPKCHFVLAVMMSAEPIKMNATARIKRIVIRITPLLFCFLPDLVNLLSIIASPLYITVSHNCSYVITVIIGQVKSEFNNP